MDLIVLRIVILSFWFLLTCLQTGFFCRVYEAEIEEIDRENGTAAINFIGYGNAEVVPLQNIKALEEGMLSIDDGGAKAKSK